MLIAADVGGTKTSIAIIDDDKKILKKETHLNDNFNNFDDFLDSFVGEYKIDHIGLGLATPIFDNKKIKLTNSNWKIDIEKLKQKYNANVYCINDLFAAAHYVDHLSNNDLKRIYRKNNDENLSQIKLIVSIGTGVGLAHYTKNLEINASEGGHIGFTPYSNFHKDLFNYINKKEIHVSYEMIISSIGFKNLRDYLTEIDNLGLSEKFIEKLKISNEIGKLIFDKSKNINDDGNICKTIIEEISFSVGSYLADLALLFLPQEIYLTGGIGRNIIDEKSIMKGYFRDERHLEITEKINLDIVKNPDLALYGVIQYLFKILNM
ncbi:MAG: glucokinase [Candidatus Kariarchaeum pelagius]|jgi:glucokinase